MKLKPNEKLKIKARDGGNYSPIYVERSDDCVLILDETFGEPDPEKMIVMSCDQFRKLQKVKI